MNCMQRMGQLHPLLPASLTQVFCPDILCRYMALVGPDGSQIRKTEIQDAMPGHSFLDGRYYYNPYMIKMDAPPAVIKTVPKH